MSVDGVELMQMEVADELETWSWCISTTLPQKNNGVQQLNRKPSPQASRHRTEAILKDRSHPEGYNFLEAFGNKIDIFCLKNGAQKKFHKELVKFGQKKSKSVFSLSDSGSVIFLATHYPIPFPLSPAQSKSSSKHMKAHNQNLPDLP